MRLVVDPKVRQFIATEGGVVTVAARSQRCCTGALTTLAVKTTAPADPSRYQRFEDEGVTVYFSSARGAPDELVLKLRGSRRPKLEALWDGCVYAI